MPMSPTANLGVGEGKGGGRAFRWKMKNTEKVNVSLMEKKLPAPQ